MATAALQVAGTALGGPIGGFVGAAIGSYLDQAFIMPALFPQDPVQGPRLGELQLQGQDEGAAMNVTYAQRCRVGGVLIWISELKETKTTTEIGKGGGQEVENFSYAVDVAVSFADAVTAYESIDRIYADVGLVYDNTPNINLSSILFSCSVVGTYYPQVSFDSESQTWSTTMILQSQVLTVSSTTLGLDLGELKSGRDVVLGGWTETDYNATFRCKSSTHNDDGSSSATFDLPTTASDAGEAAGNTITVDQTNPKFDDADMSAINVHLGGPAQGVDSFLEGVLGVGNVPAYRDEVYVVIQNFQLAKFGNRVPNFQGVLFRGTTDDLEDVFNDILNESDLLPAQYDTTALNGIVCKGYATRGPQPILGRLQPLMMTYDVLARESNGVLTFFQRQNVATKALDVDDLSAHAEGQREVPVPHLLDDDADIDPPAEMLVKYVDDQNQLQPGEQIERNPAAPGKFEKRSVEVPITMDGGEGRDLCAKLLWMSSTGARVAEIMLPPSHVDVQENDLLTYTYLGEPHTYIVDEVNEGQDGTYSLTIRRELTANLTHSSPHEEPQNPATAQSSPYDCDVSVIDLSPLQGAHADSPVLYFAATSNQRTVSWRGATLYESADGGTTYTSVLPMNTAASMGYTGTALGVGTGPAQWDRGSVIEVTLTLGQLSTITEIECLNGLNRAVVGDEIIGFVTATLSATQPDQGTRYDLSDLMRGLGGTEQAMDDHNIGDRFIHLNALGIEVTTKSIATIGSSRTYVAVSPGGDPTDFSPRPWIYQANSMRDFAPAHVQSELGAPAANDWTVMWQRRTRSSFRVLSQIAPMLENAEVYEVDVYNAGGTLVLRTITTTATANGSQVSIVSDNPQVVYDEQDQITDFGLAQSTIRLRIYQISSSVGRGRGTELLVIS